MVTQRINHTNVTKDVLYFQVNTHHNKTILPDKV